MAKTPKEIAEHIRKHVSEDEFAEMQRLHPDHQHLIAMTEKVAVELGLDPDARTVGWLTEHVEPHCTPPSREYPKVVGKRKIGEREGLKGVEDLMEDIVADSAEHEAELVKDKASSDGAPRLKTKPQRFED